MDSVCPVIEAFLFALSPNGSGEPRIHRLLAGLVGTRTQDRAIMTKRAYVAVDAAVRVAVPTALERDARSLTRREGLKTSKLRSLANLYRTLPEVIDASGAFAAARLARSTEDVAPPKSPVYIAAHWARCAAESMKSTCNVASLTVDEGLERDRAWLEGAADEGGVLPPDPHIRAVLGAADAAGRAFDGAASCLIWMGKHRRIFELAERVALRMCAVRD